jgi:cathepsin B
MMKVAILLALVCASTAFFAEERKPLITRENLEKTSSSASFETYSYDEHPFKNWTEEEIKNMLGVKTFIPFNYNSELIEDNSDSLPANFDSRTQWPDCVHAIRDQGHCGSCWAFAASEVLSDRFCIASKGKTNLVLSPQDLVSCDKVDHGCNGGNPLFSWMYLMNKGIVSDECMPYSSGSGEVEKCPTHCANDNVEFVRYHSAGMPQMLNNNEQKIKESIFAHGPVETGFTVYEDFMSYKSGIYSHKSGKMLGGHAVKIVGWGEEEGVKYWIAANSWSEKWGENGFFRIQVGQCNFEGMAIAGLPKL